MSFPPFRAMTYKAGTRSNDKLFGTSGDDFIFGWDGDDGLAGLEGDDILDGGAGGDEMAGGTGDDKYYVDNAADKVIEHSNEGTDTVYTSISYTLGTNVEHLVLQETGGPINGTGNNLNNQITGNSSANVRIRFRCLRKLSRARSGPSLVPR